MTTTRNAIIKAVRSDGRAFIYGGDDWGLVELKGVDFPTIEIFKANRGYGNGSIITGKRKQSRQIKIRAKEMDRTKTAEDRAAAIGFHNSNYTFDLHITYLGVIRIAKDCQLELAELPSGNVHDRLYLKVSFLHPESDLLGEGSASANFTKTKPLYHFTKVFKPNGGKVYFGSISHTDKRIINYLGSEDTYVKVFVTAHGLVDGLNVKVGASQLHIGLPLGENDRLVIDSEKKTVKLNGSDVAPYLYNGEVLPKLMLRYGDNEVMISADDPGNISYDADISYVGRYGGL